MTKHETSMTPEFEASLRAKQPRSRYERALEVRELMNANSIGLGDIDLLDALDDIEGQGELMGDVPLAYESIVKDVPGEYQWHGNQDDLWEMLTEAVRIELRERGLLDEDEGDLEDEEEE